MVHHILVYECNDDFPRELLNTTADGRCYCFKYGHFIFEATSCKHNYCQRKFLLKNCIEIILFKDYLKNPESVYSDRSSRYSSGNKAYSP